MSSLTIESLDYTEKFFTEWIGTANSLGHETRQINSVPTTDAVRLVPNIKGFESVVILCAASNPDKITVDVQALGGVTYDEIVKDLLIPIGLAYQKGKCHFKPGSMSRLAYGYWELKSLVENS